MLCPALPFQPELSRRIFPHRGFRKKKRSRAASPRRCRVALVGEERCKVRAEKTITGPDSEILVSHLPPVYRREPF